LRIDAKSKEAFTFSQSGPARRLLDCVGDLEHSDASEHRARTGIDPRRSSSVTTAQNAAPEQRVLEPRQPRHIGASVAGRRRREVDRTTPIADREATRMVRAATRRDDGARSAGRPVRARNRGDGGGATPKDCGAARDCHRAAVDSWTAVVGTDRRRPGATRHPRPNPMSIGMTMVVGIGGSLLGGLVGALLFGRPGGLLLAVAGAALIVADGARSNGGSPTPRLTPVAPPLRPGPAPCMG